MSTAQIIEKINRIRIPESIGREQLALATRDAEILADRLRSAPDRMQALVEALLNDDREPALRLLSDLDLTEEDVRKEGGGLFWLIVLAVVLYSTDAY
ncbi:hypothetical protein ACQP2Y_11575 [Actinoplanes sp. CA-051413]|uniref:hypothetical protein n=1 Tax=Actinoplanes sp. CA-051413 TaxID=3239899 RepID=UPI003D994315